MPHVIIIIFELIFSIVWLRTIAWDKQLPWLLSNLSPNYYHILSREIEREREREKRIILILCQCYGQYGEIIKYIIQYHYYMHDFKILYLWFYYDFELKKDKCCRNTMNIYFIYLQKSEFRFEFIHILFVCILLR